MTVEEYIEQEKETMKQVEICKLEWTIDQIASLHCDKIRKVLDDLDIPEHMLCSTIQFLLSHKQHLQKQLNK